jgi:hypothetical protein
MRYERPVLIKSYSLAELRADAATCSIYPPPALSDERLKTDIEPV